MGNIFGLDLAVFTDKGRPTHLGHRRHGASHLAGTQGWIGVSSRLGLGLASVRKGWFACTREQGTSIPEMVDLYEFITDVPDFPEPGIVFKDITPLLASPAAFLQAVDEMAEPFTDASVDIVVGIESRGFLLAGSIAERIGSGVGLVRKPGKLPRETVSVTYDLEYGTDTLEIHKDAFPQGARVLIVDDVLATGGTLAASKQLIEKANGFIVGATMLLELSFLDGRSRFDDPLHAVLVY